jgi:hypothetical protein
MNGLPDKMIAANLLVTDLVPDDEADSGAARNFR